MRKAASILKIGDKFGRWTVISDDFIIKSGGRSWLCRCDCGTEKYVRGSAMRNGHTISCGCFASEETARRNTNHGMFGTRPYGIWNGLRGRCNNPNYPYYHRYGGRGITVCDKWETFEGFWEDMQDGYADDLTIDRIDNDGNYCKENCKWSTQIEQANNMSVNRNIEYKGRTQTMKQWADECGIPYGTFQQRIYDGWDIARAIETPVDKMWDLRNPEWRATDEFREILRKNSSKPIVQLTLDGKFVKEWPSSTVIGQELHIDRHDIIDCCKGRRKSVKGFYWEYKQTNN